LGLIFLKYISDAFEAKHAELEAQRVEGADPEDPDEYRAASIFWVPTEARWSHLRANARQRRRPRPRHARPGLRVLPRPLRQRRGQERRPVLHALACSARSGRDACAVQGPRLRPLL